MTVRVDRSFEFAASPGDVWSFIADPGERAAAISVVEDYEVNGREATWHVKLPIPFLSRTIEVRTRDVERDPPRYVRFTGKSKAFEVVGEHTIEATATGCRVRNEFVVDGRLPGVERFFSRNLDAELANLERHIREHVEE